MPGHRQFLEPRVGENRIGLNMSTFGATNAIAALVVGRLSDRIGRLIPLTFGTIVYCGTLVSSRLSVVKLSVCSNAHTVPLCRLLSRSFPIN